MLKNFKLSSFGAGILAGGIILVVGNIGYLFEGTLPPGFIIGIVCIILGAMIYILKKPQ